MAVDVDLRSKIVTILNNAAIPVEQGKITDTRGEPRVWLRRANSSTDVFMSGGAGLTETRFDVEVHGSDIAEVQTLADSIKALHTAGGLNGLAGTLGASEVLGVFVEDHADDYEPRGVLDSDEGMHVAALDVLVIQA